MKSDCSELHTELLRNKYPASIYESERVMPHTPVLTHMTLTVITCEISLT